MLFALEGPRGISRPKDSDTYIREIPNGPPSPGGQRVRRRAFLAIRHNRKGQLDFLPEDIPANFLSRAEIQFSFQYALKIKLFPPISG